MANSDPGEVRDSDGEHLGQPVLPDGVAEALRAAAEDQQDRAQLIQEAQDLGLIGDGETITVAEARQRLADHQAQQAQDEARAVIAGTGDDERDIANTEAEAQPERDAKGRRLFRSEFDPERMVARMRPGDVREIDQLVQWYSEMFDSEDLTAQEALHLIMDARSQGLYRRDRESHERTPMPVRDEELRGRLVELFGEGTENEGRAEAVLQWLREQERDARQGHDEGQPVAADNESPDAGMRENRGRKWTGEELEGTISALEVQIHNLEEEDPELVNPDSLEKWKQILDDFFSEQLVEYGGAKGDRIAPPNDIKGRGFRERALALFKEAEQKYFEARRKAEAARASSERQRNNVAPAVENQPGEALDDDEFRTRLEVLEVRADELRQSDPNNWEQWRQIMNEFFRRDLMRYTAAKGNATPRIDDSGLQHRARRLFEDARASLAEAESQSGLATSGKEASEHAREARRAERAARRANREPEQPPYDLEEGFEDFRAKQAMNRDSRDPSGLVEEERARRRGGQGAPQQSTEPFQFAAEPMGVQGPNVSTDPIDVQVPEPAQEPQVAQEPPEPDLGEPEQDTTEQDDGASEQAADEDPLVTRAVDRVRREWQRAIDRERDPGQRARMEGMRDDEIAFERDRITAELRLEADRERRDSLGRSGA